MHTRRRCRRLRAGETESTTQVLLRAFQTSLLQTYKSKFTQVRRYGRGVLGALVLRDAESFVTDKALLHAVSSVLCVCARCDAALLSGVLPDDGALLTGCSIPLCTVWP